MRKSVLGIGLAIGLLTVSACNRENGSAAEGEAAGEAANGEGAEQTIGAGLDQGSRFFQAVKAAGLDATLTGPGPYTVLVPADAAFARLPASTAESWATPEGRGELTGILTYHILPGTVLAEDIGKAIDNSKGEAVLATMGGGTITATRDGNRILLTDGAGNRATVAEADRRYSNGVAHHIDGVLMPPAESQPQG